MKSISAIAIAVLAILIEFCPIASARAQTSGIKKIDLISRDFNSSTQVSLSLRQVISLSNAFRCTIQDSVSLSFFDERLRRKRNPVTEEYGIDPKIICIVRRDNGAIDTVDFGIGYMRIGPIRYDLDEILLWFLERSDAGQSNLREP